MMNIYIRYNTTGEVEFYDSVATAAEANEIIDAMKDEDDSALAAGIPIEDCSYYYEEAAD